MKVNSKRKKTSKIEDNTTQLDEHWSFFEMKIKPKPVSHLMELAKRLIKWSKDPMAMRIEQFWVSEEIHREDWYRWCKKHDFMQNAYDFALEALGERRGGRLENNEMNGQFVPRLAMYSHRYKEYEIWRSKLNKDEQKSNEPQIVVIEKMPDTNVKKKE